MEQTNILGSMPVGRLVVHMSWPIMLSMLMQAVYNLVDSVFVAQISDQAFLALSYAYPIQTLMIAFCSGFGVAFSAMLSKRLGRADLPAANRSVLHGFLFFAGNWILFFLFGALAAPLYLQACTDSSAVVQMGTDYLRVCCCCSIGMCMQFPMERILQSTGHPTGFMIIQGSGAVINLILDPILIFGLDMGVTGAAVATVIGQITGALIGVFLVRRVRNQLPVSFRRFHIQRDLAAEFVQIAAPAVLMQSLASFMSLGLNAILSLWSETAVWVLGVYFKLQSFVFMPVFSINNGLVSILSYNYGAAQRTRIIQGIRFGLQVALTTALVGTVLLWLGAVPLLHCFQAPVPAMSMGVPALRMTALAFPVASVSIILSAAFQSLGYSRYSLSVSLLRYVVVPLPAALILVRWIPDLTFLSFLVAELATVLIAALLYRKVFRERIQQI